MGKLKGCEALAIRTLWGLAVMLVIVPGFVPPQLTEEQLAATRWFPSALDLSQESVYDCVDAADTLGMINDFRLNHNAPSLLWSTNLTDEAKQHLASVGACAARDAPGWSFSPSIPSAYGISFKGEGRTFASFKCVSAVVDWYFTSQLLNFSSLYADNSKEVVQAAATVLWKSSESVGCALAECGADNFIVWCFFDPQPGTFKEAELAAQVAKPEGTCPQVHKLNSRDNLLTVAKSKSKSLRAEDIFCYRGQVTAEMYDQQPGDLLVAIPCDNNTKTDYTSGSCPELDLYMGLTNGLCPSTHMMLPTETLESVAQLYSKYNMKNKGGFDLTADDLCCYNQWAQVEEGMCDLSDPNSFLGPLQGFYSTIAIPCPEDVVSRNCKNDNLQRGVHSCADSMETTSLMNDFRRANHLVPMQWNTTLEAEARNIMQGADFCPSVWATNYTYTSPMWSIPFAILANAVSATCAAQIGVAWSYFYDFESYKQLFQVPEDDIDPSVFDARYLVGVVLDNATTSFGCALQVCGSWFTGVTCVFGAAKDDTYSTFAETVDTFVPEPGSCPVVYFPKPMESLDDVAARFDVTPEAIVCYNQLQEWKDYRQRSLSNLPLAIPCKDQQIEECQAALLRERGDGACDVSYLPRPGETVDELAYHLNITSTELCCANNMTTDCAMNPLQLYHIPCTTEQSASTACGIPDTAVCRRQYRVVEGQTIEDIAQQNAVSTSELCCYWHQPSPCSVPPEQIVLLPCRQELDALGCTDIPVGAASNGDSGVSVVAIVVPVVVGTVCAAVLVILALWYWRQKKNCAADISSKTYLEQQFLSEMDRQDKGSTSNESRSNGSKGPPLQSLYLESLAESTTGSEKSRESNRSSVIDPGELKICTDRNGKPLKLGSGGFATVLRGKYRGEIVAVKMMHATSTEANQNKSLQAFIKEIAHSRRCMHDNIVHFIGAAFHGQSAMLVFEFMEQGNLFNLLHNAGGDECRWYNRGHKIALDVAAGVSYLHSINMIHVDIKSPNIMLTGEGQAKVGDMGMAKYQEHTYVTKEGQIGSYVWAAPELLMNSRIDRKVDVYSFGVVLWEIVTGELPARGELRPARVPEECPQEVADLIKDCLAFEPSHRPHADEVFRRLCKLSNSSQAN